MAILDSLKSKKLPMGVFREIKQAPKPARIFITIPWIEELNYLEGLIGFDVHKPNEKYPQGTISFEIPVTPPTVQMDFGNSKDTENVARMGEVVLPKFKKAIQYRWESFFPYDTNAKYISTTVRNLKGDTFNNLKNMAVDIVDVALQTTFGFGIKKDPPCPDDYIIIFNYLSLTEKPFQCALKFYEGGSIPALEFTLDSFECEPENNGDYKYSIALVQWTDIKPVRLDVTGKETKLQREEVPDRTEQTSGLTDSTGGDKSGFLGAVSKFWNFCKRVYPTVSKSVAFAFATYNGVRNLCFSGAMIAWKIKGSLKDMGQRFGIVNSLLGLSKITSKDTKAVSRALRQLSFTEESQHMAEWIKNNM